MSLIAVLLPSMGRALAGDLYLEVSLNGLPTQMVARFSEQGGRLSTDGQSLDEVGLNLATLGVNASQQVRLDDLPGLTYHYDVSQQSVDLQVIDSLRKVQRLSFVAPTQPRPSVSDRGLVLNYDAYASHDDSGTRVALWSEERFFDAHGVYSNTGTAYSYQSSNQQHYVRYDTAWSNSDPDTLSTWQLGDTISGSLDWTRSVRLGGAQYKSNFALRPDLVTFPLPAYSGSAVVPSAVNLYVNGIQQYSGSVATGPYIIDQMVPGITGSGEATIVTHDALGRSVSTSVPLYVDTRLMASGLSSFSMELGYLRRNYSVDSFDYSPRTAGSASVRYGINDVMTVEGHSEITAGVYNAGGGALYRLGQAGVINGSLAASAGMAGLQWGLGYQYVAPGFSISVQTQRTTGNYGDLAARDGSPVPSVSDRLTLSFPVAGNQSLSLSYMGYKVPGSGASNIVSVGHSMNLSQRLSTSLSLYQDVHDSKSRGAFVNLSYSLGERTSVSSSLSYQNKQTGYTVNAVQTPEYSGGWGWGAQSSGNNGNDYQQAQVQYLGNDTQVVASAQQVAGANLYSVDATGALVWMDGSLQTARRIGDGFALVSTDGVAGIPVIHENREIGTTDRSGHFLVPDLDAYRSNKVSINSLELPANVQVATTDQAVVPQSRSGVVVRFALKPYQAASVILQDAAGKLLPSGLRVYHLESGASTVIGYDGITFVDGLVALNHLQVDGDHVRCQVTFTFTPPTDNSLPTLGPLQCLPTSEKK
ncbi:fimbria/pilus outer membrane usher protein [Pseudomonas chlororaphis]|uniref:fimbria/pilus outer membrane usher protein n=1 Tax=Pseudomonas chlororaphis TaxID=587753 RepID=UPI0019266957|nr:fimbria/pilus outer membrane usher protein [Pseudomonas chlororaphis]QQX57087.1 fimbrial biogenesis outer membrane usher protein [Pseudomonas chlororaphis subsp. aurantiaca]